MDDRTKSLVDRALAQVERINAGLLRVRPNQPWPYCDIATFRDEDGWNYEVFVDCDEFDYFEVITTNNRERLDAGDPDHGDYFMSRFDHVCFQIDTLHRAKWGIPQWCC